MEKSIRQYIKDEVSKLEYVGDEIKLKYVYPAILEDVLGDFDEPYELSGYDCDYWAKTDEYSISGCMSYGHATITLCKGKEKPLNDKEESRDSSEQKLKKELTISEKINMYKNPPEGSEKWETFYCTFGGGQWFQGSHQPIKAENRSKAHKRMHSVYGTKWSFIYTQDEWIGIDCRDKGNELELIYAE